MPWSGGVYTRTNGVFTGATLWQQSQAAGYNILSTQFDTSDQDIATGLNNCATIDGLNRMAASFVPSVDATYSLGSSSLRWGNVSLSSSAMFYNGSTNAVTVQAGTLTSARSVILGDFAGTVVLDTATQTLTNKTLTGPIFGPTGTSSGQTGIVQLEELAANGTNVTGFKAPDSLAADVIYTMPSADGSSGQFLKTNGSKVLSWAAAGTVTSIVAGTGLTGGTITSTGTVALDASYLQGYLGGLTLSNDGSTPNTVLDIAAGVCVDSTNAVFIKLGAFTKSTGGSWAAGSGSNGMGTGLTIANSTWYHVFAIINNGSADVYFDTSVTAANKPASTTAFRRIGSFITDSSAHIVAFSQNGDEFLWSVIRVDANAATISSGSGTNYTVSVPLGIKCGYLGHYLALGNASATTFLFTSPDESDQAVSNAAEDFSQQVNSLGFSASLPAIRTNTSSQIRGRSFATAAGGVTLGGRGYIDTRGRFA